MNSWDQILVELESKVGTQNFSIWLRPTSMSHQDNGTLFVRVPNSTCKDWIAEHYTDEIREAITHLQLPLQNVEFIPGGQIAMAAVASSPGPRASQDSGKL